MSSPPYSKISPTSPPPPQVAQKAQVSQVSEPRHTVAPPRRPDARGIRSPSSSPPPPFRKIAPTSPDEPPPPPFRKAPTSPSPVEEEEPKNEI